jgi:hypothetical protein
LHYNLWNPTSLGDLFRTFIVVKKLVLHNAWSQQTGTDETVMFVCRVKEGWKQQREELDRLWASNGGKAYAERNKPSLFYNTWK